MARSKRVVTLTVQVVTNAPLKELRERRAWEWGLDSMFNADRDADREIIVTDIEVTEQKHVDAATVLARQKKAR